MTVPDTAKEIIDFIIEQDEGGWVYTNHPYDLGGPTYAGVAGKWFIIWYNKKHGPTLGYTTIETFIEHFQNVDNVAHFNELIYEFYMDEFYTPMGLDSVGDTELCATLLSCAVNVGMDEAPVWLQESINDVGKDILKTPGSKFTMLKVDGKIGSKTIAALEQIDQSYNHYVSLNNLFILDYWIPKYIRKVRKNPGQLINLKGWYARARRYVIV